MKKGMSILMGAAALLAAGVLSAQEVKTFNKAADWNKSPAITDGEGCLKVSRNVMLVSPRFKIDPNKNDKTVTEEEIRMMVDVLHGVIPPYRLDLQSLIPPKFLFQVLLCFFSFHPMYLSLQSFLWMMASFRTYFSARILFKETRFPVPHYALSDNDAIH